MNRIQEKLERYYDELVKIFGEDAVSVIGSDKIRAKCPICFSNKKTLFFDAANDRLTCVRCKFKASSIFLFIDAYCAEPTGDFLEDSGQHTAKNMKQMPEIIIRRSNDKNNNETNHS